VGLLSPVRGFFPEERGTLMQPGVQEERPPFVRFERRAVEKRRLAPPEGDGTSYYVDVDFAIITPQGTKDVVEKVAVEWFAYLDQMVSQRRYDPRWLAGFREMFKHWKEGQTIPLNGFAISNWPVATPSQVKTLHEYKVFTVEDLAALPAEGVSRLGMGGISLKNKAIAFLEAQSGTAPLVNRLDAMSVALNAAMERLSTLEAENKALKSAQQSREEPAAPLEDLATRLAIAQGPSNDAFESHLTKL
jgi:hypothetical protein